MPPCTAPPKFALEGFTEALRHELRPFNIAAVVVAPGLVSTPAGDTSKMLPKAEKEKVDFEAMKEKMVRRKEHLVAHGVPPVGEDRMVRASRGSGDSPAQAARRKPPKLSQKK